MIILLAVAGAICAGAAAAGADLAVLFGGMSVLGIGGCVAWLLIGGADAHRDYGRVTQDQPPGAAPLRVRLSTTRAWWLAARLSHPGHTPAHRAPRTTARPDAAPPAAPARPHTHHARTKTAR